MSNDRVRVYKNTTLGVWSVKRAGQPVEHWASLLLKNVTFVVQPRGRERVLKEKRKGVHAFAVGEILTGLRLDPQGDTRKVGHPQTSFGMDHYRNTRKGLEALTLFGMGPQRNTFPVGYCPFSAPFFTRKDTHERLDEVDRLYFPAKGPPQGWDLAGRRSWEMTQKGLER